MATLAYAETTASVTVTHTLAQADTVVTAGPFTLTDDTRVRCEFFAQVVEIPAGYYDLNLGVFDGTALLRLIVGRFHNQNVNSPDDVEAYAAVYLTLAAGTHNLAVKGYRSPGSPVTPGAIVAAGDGAGTDFPPCYLAVTVADQWPV